ncbi:hypothetical protein Plhal304r1_c044g0124581 [Plasmopara halstedii]
MCTETVHCDHHLKDAAGYCPLVFATTSRPQQNRSIENGQRLYRAHARQILQST